MIKSKDDSYLIYGIELSNIDENSMELPTDETTVKKLKSVNTFSQILEGIQDGVGFLWGDVVTGSIEKPSYTMYYFSSMEEGERGDYQVYILFYIQGDLKYIEVCMMDLLLFFIVFLLIYYQQITNYYPSQMTSK